MEQKHKGLAIDLSRMERGDILALRQVREHDITDAINDINAINVELNSRVGRTALPEFGSPIVSYEQLEFPDSVA